MARIRGTFKRSRFELVPNPAYAGKTPSPLKAECHDGSPFITIQCDCGVQLHQHESSVVAVPADAEIASRCPSCRKTLVFEPGFFARAFQQLRDQGWVAA
jgi:hypothetical protein